MTLEASPEDVARFMRYVEKLPNGCWFWSGARSRGRGNRKWYGSFRLGRRTVRAHRFACEVLGGRDCPAEHDRDHTCRFSLCVNPDHLEVVHKLENQRRRHSAPGDVPAEVLSLLYMLSRNMRLSREHRELAKTHSEALSRVYFGIRRP